MEEIEFFNELQRLKSEYVDSVNNLNIKYAMSHNTVKIGDIITDHVGSIKVSNINVGTPFMAKLPTCVYCGREYTKKGEPKKNGGFRDVWQDNLIK